MHLFVQVGRFLVFLIAYGAWLWAAQRFSNRLTRNIRRGITFWNNQIGLLLSVVPPLVFVYLLSGYFNWRLVFLFIVVGQVGIVVGGILWALLGSTENSWAARGTFAGGEVGMKQQRLLSTMSLVVLVILVAYPVAAGIAYFRLNPAVLATRIFQYTIGPLIFSGYLVLLPVIIGVLTSKDLDEDTRSRYLAAQAGQLVLVGLFLAVAFWAFGIGKSTAINVGEIALPIEPRLLVLLIAYFASTCLIPYVIGVQRAKRWRIELIAKQQRWLSELQEILLAPTASLYGGKLASFQIELQQEAESFRQTDTIFELEVAASDDQLAPKAATVIEAFRLSRGLDPRFNYIDWISQLIDKVQEVIEGLEQDHTDLDKENAAQRWAAVVQKRAGELDDRAKSLETRRAAVLVGFGLVMTPLLGGVLSEFAKSLWQVFAGSAHK